MSKRDDGLYIDDIRQSVENIFEFIGDSSREDFVKDKKTYSAVIRELMIIGEAANSVSDEFKEEHSDMPWYEMSGIRNRLIHEYFSIDHDIVWDTYENDLPKLRNALVGL